MRTRTPEDGQNHARECFSRGLNCAESVLRGVSHAQEMDLPDACLRMATPFGGGIGRSQDVCGALAGAVMAVGASLGRTSADEDKSTSYEAAGMVFRDFVQTFGSCRCSDLNMGDFKSAEHRARCDRFVGEAARLAILAIRRAPARRP